MSKFIKLGLLFGVLSLSLSAAAFDKNQSADAVESEVQLRLKNGETLQTIAASAFDAGVLPGVLTLALISEKQDPSAVVGALVTAGFPANVVVNAAVTTGAPYGTMLASAVNAGADPGSITPPTGAGRSGPAGNSGGTPGNASSGGGGPAGIVSRS